MSKFSCSMMLVVAVAACGGADASTDLPKASGSGASGGSAPRVVVPATSTVPAGTAMHISIQEQLSSRTAKPGQAIHAVTTSDVLDSRGRVAIPSGSSVTLNIVKLEPGSDQIRPEGRLELSTSSVTVRGETIPLNATVGAVPHRMQGRGITKDEAGRVAAGTAIGAIAGQVIGKNTKSTVIGGAVGAVAGGAAAARYAYRDVVIDSGAQVTLTLNDGLTVRAM